MLVADSTKAKKVLGWQPRISFKELVRVMVDYDVAAIGLVLFVSPMLFAWGENAELRAFAFDPSGRVKLLAHGSELASGPLAVAPDNMGGMPGGMLTVSANGQNEGVVWGTAPVNGDANKKVVDGIVRAYDASDFDPAPGAGAPQKLRLLWQQAGFKYSKFCPPIVADGKLLVPTYDGQVDVYELN